MSSSLESLALQLPFQTRHRPNQNPRSFPSISDHHLLPTYLSAAIMNPKKAADDRTSTSAAWGSGGVTNRQPHTVALALRPRPASHAQSGSQSQSQAEAFQVSGSQATSTTFSNTRIAPATASGSYSNAGAQTDTHIHNATTGANAANAFTSGPLHKSASAQALGYPEKPAHSPVETPTSAGLPTLGLAAETPAEAQAQRAHRIQVFIEYRTYLEREKQWYEHLIDK